MRVLIIDDDKLFGSMLKFQISDFTNNEADVLYISDTNHVKLNLEGHDIILIDKNLENCSYSSEQVISFFEEVGMGDKIIIISGTIPSEELSKPFLIKSENLAKILVSQYF